MPTPLSHEQLAPEHLLAVLKTGATVMAGAAGAADVQSNGLLGLKIDSNGTSIVPVSEEFDSDDFPFPLRPLVATFPATVDGAARAWTALTQGLLLWGERINGDGGPADIGLSEADLERLFQAIGVEIIEADGLPGYYDWRYAPTCESCDRSYPSKRAAYRGAERWIEELMCEHLGFIVDQEVSTPEELGFGSGRGTTNLDLAALQDWLWRPTQDRIAAIVKAMNEDAAPAEEG